MLLIFSTTILDFERTVEGVYTLPKGGNVASCLSFGAFIKEKGCAQHTIGKYNVYITEMQFLRIAKKRISK